MTSENKYEIASEELITRMLVHQTLTGDPYVHREDGDYIIMSDKRLVGPISNERGRRIAKRRGPNKPMSTS